MKSQHSHIGLPDAQQIKDYLAGKLNAADAHQVELALQNSQWGDDVLEGLELDPTLVGMDKVMLPSQSAWSAGKILGIVIPIVLVGSAIVWFMNKENIASNNNLVENNTTIISQPEDIDPSEEQSNEEYPVVLESSSTDSSFSFTVETPTASIAIAEEQPEEHFIEVTRIDIPDPLPALDAEPVIDLHNSPTSTIPIKKGMRIYHIRDYKVVDYRGIRKSTLSKEDLSQTGTPANYSAEEIAYNRVRDSHVRQKHIAYVDWLEYAMIAFAQEHYSHAISRFDVVLKDFPQDANALFYKGMTHYYQQDYTQAAKLLEQSQSLNISTFSEESEYYRAECLWMVGEKQLARQMFKRISFRGGFYAERAEQKID